MPAADVTGNVNRCMTGGDSDAKGSIIRLDFGIPFDIFPWKHSSGVACATIDH
jgi:hypothetical protein